LRFSQRGGEEVHIELTHNTRLGPGSAGCRSRVLRA
jgi:hypothetical protein